MEAGYTTEEGDLITVMEHQGVANPSNGIDLGDWLARVEEPVALVSMAPDDPKLKIITSIVHYAAIGTNVRMFDNKWYGALGD